MNTLPLDLWFKISSYDFTIWRTLMHTFKGFSEFMQKNKGLLFKTFGSIINDTTTTFPYISEIKRWKIANYSYRVDQLPHILANKEVVWNRTEKPILIRDRGVIIGPDSKIKIEFDGDYFVKSEKYLVYVGIASTYKKPRFYDLRKLFYSNVGIIVWKEERGSKPMDMYTRGNIAYKQVERKEIRLPFWLYNNGNFI